MIVSFFLVSLGSHTATSILVYMYDTSVTESLLLVYGSFGERQPTQNTPYTKHQERYLFFLEWKQKQILSSLDYFICFLLLFFLPAGFFIKHDHAVRRWRREMIVAIDAAQRLNYARLILVNFLRFILHFFQMVSFFSFFPFSFLFSFSFYLTAWVYMRIVKGPSRKIKKSISLYRRTP